MKLLKPKHFLASFACCVLLSLSYVALANEQTIDEANRLDAEVMKLYGQGHYKEAIPYAKRSLDIVKSIYGDNHANASLNLNNLAELYRKTFNYTDAEPLYRQSIDILEKAYGSEDLVVASRINNLAVLYASMGRHDEAELLYKRVIEIYKLNLVTDSLDIAHTLNNLAGLYDTTGRYTEAEALYKKSIKMLEKLKAEDSYDFALTLNNLAEVYRKMANFSDAEGLYTRSLSIYKSTSNQEHPDALNCLSNLALLYHETGKYQNAEEIYKNTLVIRIKAQGPQHPEVALTLNNIAGLYKDTAKYFEAVQLYKKSLEIYEKVLGPYDQHTAQVLNNFGDLLLNMSDYTHAEEILKKSLAIKEKTLGANHPDVALTLNNLGVLYKNTAKYSEAEFVLKRSLEIREESLGTYHPDVAQSLSNLAGFYQDTARYYESEILYKKSLVILQNISDKVHPSLAINHSNLAGIYAAQGKHAESNAAFINASIIQEDNRELAFQLLSEKQKSNYLSQQDGTMHAFITHTAQSMTSSPVAIADTFNAWLRWKGSVAEAQGRYQEAVSRSTDPLIKSKFDELINIRRDLGSLRLSKPEKLSFNNYQLAMDKLEKQKEVLEAALSKLSKDFTLDKNAGRADIKKLSAILPQNSIYLDFAKIQVYDFKKAMRGEEKYFAFILIPQKDPVVKLVEIADAKSLDSLLKTYLQEMNRIKTHGVTPDQAALNKSAKDIYNILFKPLEQYAIGKQNLFISPDGNLSLIPFELLISPDGKRLIENHTISYVGAGRDIVRFSDTATTAATALIMADPDYNLGQKDKQQIAAQMKVTIGGHGNVTRDASRLSFTPLPDTKQEADAISKVLSSSMNLAVHNYQNKNALEGVLFTGVPPRILHLATHGYFLNNEDNKGGSTTTRGLVVKEKAGLGYDDLVVIENPMLRSGIALAGVNSSLKDGRDDGLVSAEKILGLRLKGTDLVVLSACETGVGDVKNGEGVFGLKRAFILSGAKSLVMSLWSVPSAETTELMTNFYTLMAAGNSKTDALRQAKLNMMKKKPNPFYWGAFVLTGKPN